MTEALLVSLLAGLATAVGGWLATHRRVLDHGVLAFLMAFSAGAMIFLSLVEIMPLGREALLVSFNPHTTDLLLYGIFALGIFLVALIDRFVPESINPSEVEGTENDHDFDTKHRSALLRSGVMVAAVLTLHNVPEGMSTFVAANQDLTSGIALAVAVAIHNIPEGIAIAAPVFAATRSRAKAFWAATLSGLTEPIGGLIAALLLATILPTSFTGLFLGLVAGMMTFIAIDELMPAAKRYQTSPHQSVYGFLTGVVIVALSLVLIQMA